MPTRNEKTPEIIRLDLQLEDLETQSTKLSAERAIAHESYDQALNSSNDTNVRNTRTDHWLREISAIDKRLTDVSSQASALLKERDKLLSALPGDPNVASTISALTTRIGAVVILLFLVQILTSLFRYNMMLAAQYDARADGLTLLPWDVSSANTQALEQIVRTLSPQGVSFGPAPTSPVEGAIGLVGRALGKR